MRKRFYWRLAFLTLGGMIVASLGLMAGAYMRISNGGQIVGRPIPFVRPAFDGKKQITALILGLDEKDRLNPKLGQRSDSIMLARIDLEKKTVKGISIPRDSLVEIAGTEREDKINSAYVVGGVETTIDTVEQLTNVRPDYYVVSEVSGFKKVVDLVGGIDLDVEKDMDYDDNWQNLHIHLKKGFQHLDGEQAMGYVRFRHDRFADITRMQRQQKFLRAVAQRMTALSNLPKLPQVMAEMKQAVHTNIETADLAYLATTLRHATGDNVQVETLPGEPKMLHRISYFIPDKDGVKELVAKTFDVVEVGGAATVEVLNGSGRKGLASTVAKKLEESGFKVERIANADRRDYESSKVRYRSEINLAGANEIVNILGMGEVESGEETAENGGSASSSQDAPDITVIVGKDYSDYNTL